MLRSIGVPIVLVFLAIQAFAVTDLTPDAVTRATTLNPWTGDLAALTDGRTPDNDPDAPAFEWRAIGLLAVEWPKPVSLATIRVYLGEMERYAVYGYLGGHFTETGQRVDVETPVYSQEGLVPIDATGWYDIPCVRPLPCPPEAQVDNIGFQVIGGATLYEIQFLGSDGTCIQTTTFGAIKRSLSDRTIRVLPY